MIERAAIQNGSGVTPKDSALLSVRDLVVEFNSENRVRSSSQTVVAVNGASFDVYPGEVFGIVGESGCGKTTLARAILRLIEPKSGTVHFAGQDLGSVSGKALCALRRDMQIVFQDPFGSLNPRMRIVDIVSEPLLVQKIGTRKQRREKAQTLLWRVGLGSDCLGRYPHEFSGGQRQRIGIARALATNPKLVVLDEPVSALDVSIQAQILNLLNDLRDELNLAYVFIAHDLAVVHHFCRRIAVMQKGRFVETGSVDTVFSNPQDPYTQSLIESHLEPVT